jgi:benzoyl-CoA reductase/2-hydroxyglutaryl-CoA dehydratase subunit BcrC/BadD/HgdB
VNFELLKVRKAAGDPLAAAANAKKRSGKPVIGALSSWVPDPVVIAAGATVMRFPASMEAGSRAGAHFQTSSCFYCRSVLEMGLSGALDFVDALFFVQSCDTQQNLSDIWKVALPKIPVVDLYIPVNRSSAAAGAYMEKEIRRAADELGAFTGTRVDDASLAEAIEERAGVESLLADLYSARLEASGRVSAADHYAACTASSCLPPADSRPLVSAVLEEVRSGGVVTDKKDDGPDLACVLAGSTIPYPGIYELLDQLEVAVRDDDLSLGRRLFDHPIPEGDPFSSIAASLLERPPGAVKHDEGMDRGARLAGIAEKAGVKHVVMPLLKFCDPWAWDYPRTRKRLAQEGIGTMLLEIAGGEDYTAGTVRNRVEAYFEMDRMGDLFDV